VLELMKGAAELAETTDYQTLTTGRRVTERGSSGRPGPG